MNVVHKTFCDAGNRVYSKLMKVVVADNFNLVRNLFNVTQEVVHGIDNTSHLYLFGSTAAFGFHEKGSDLDFVVLRTEDLRDGKGVDSYSQLQQSLQAKFISALSRNLRQQHPTWRIEDVLRARVPVLRMVDDNSISFDISAYRRNGIRNSALLRAYMTQFPLSRWLCMLIKKWSKEVGVNSSKIGGFLTSYAFNIMVVHYLVQKELLQPIAPESVDFTMISPLPNEIPLDALESKEITELGKLALGFLEFYLREFNPAKDVITINRGSQLTPRSELKWNLAGAELGGAQQQFLCIEDPYELNLNVGRGVTALKLTILKKHLEDAEKTVFKTA